MEQQQQQGIVFPPQTVQFIIAGIAKKMTYEDAEPLIGALRSGQVVNLGPAPGGEATPPSDKK